MSDEERGQYGHLDDTYEVGRADDEYRKTVTGHAGLRGGQEIIVRPDSDPSPENSGVYQVAIYPPGEYPPANGDAAARPRQANRRYLALLLVMAMVVIILLIAVVGLLMARSPRAAAVPDASTLTGAPSQPRPSPSSSPPSPSVPRDGSMTAGTATPSVSDSGTVDPPPSSLPPPEGSFLGGPVDDNTDTARTGVTEQIAGVSYPNSTTIGCPMSSYALLDWDVAQFRTFTAMLGIADDESGAIGATATVTFFDQNKRKLGAAAVSIGHPVPVKFGLDGATRMQVVCTAIPASSVFNVTLGNGSLAP